jgi:DNA-binding NtrC family response regulator
VVVANDGEGEGKLMPDRILVIDDEDPILYVMKEYFTTHNYEVDCARELEEAEALLANISYAVVIADMRLTGIHGVEGLELVAYVRERCPQTRIVILTAYGSPEVEKEAIRRGVDAFLRKPIPLPQLAQIVFGFTESRLL